MEFITICTSGHVDHGKTSLIKCLTGIDTDTLEQEKKRGLTIDLGFAHLKSENKTINFIDVPGHEKFLKNMLSGVTGINTVLLVIAANEGIKPQTIEHLQIIKLLSIKNLTVIISKIDLINYQEKESLKQELITYLNLNGFYDIPILEFSIYDNDSHSAILSYLLDIKTNTPINNLEIIFPIDRVFSKKGIGTIVTGTVYSGQIKTSNNLYFSENYESLKVKNIQINNENHDTVSQGQRASLNLGTIHYSLLKRGDILTNSEIQTVNSFDVSLNTVNNIKNSSLIKFYYLSNEINGRINFFNIKSVDSNKQVFAKITTDENIIIPANTKFIIRLQSPEVTLGGGRVINFYNHKRKINHIKKLELLSLLEKSDYEQAFFYLINEIYEIFSFNDLSFYIPQSELINIFEIYQLTHLSSLNGEFFILKSKFLKYEEIVFTYIKNFNQNNPDKYGLDKNTIIQNLNININILDKILEKLLEKDLFLSDNLYFFKDKKNSYTESEKVILDILNNHKFQTYKDLVQHTVKTESQVRAIISSLKLKSEICIITPDIICLTSTLTEIIAQLKEFIGNDKKTTSEIKEYFNLSRKYMIPVLEYMDKIKITYRENEYRKLVI